MEPIDTTRILGLWCAGLSVGFIWPQVARVYRRGSVEGIAPKGTLHGLAATTLWTIYGLSVRDAALIASNAAVAVGMLLIALQQVRHRVVGARAIVFTLVGVATVGGGALLVSTTAEGWLAIVVGATSVVPQTLHVLRSKSLGGVSIPTYGLLCLTTLSWTTYGLAIGDPLVVLTNLIVFPLAVLITARTWVAQRRGEAVAVDTDMVAAQLGAR